MNDEKKEKIWQEIHSVIRDRLQDRRPGEHTTSELAESWGVKRDRAEGVIQKLLSAKVLLERRGARNVIYLRPNPDINNIPEIIQDLL